MTQTYSTHKRQCSGVERCVSYIVYVYAGIMMSVVAWHVCVRLCCLCEYVCVKNRNGTTHPVSV